MGKYRILVILLFVVIFYKLDLYSQEGEFDNNAFPNTCDELLPDFGPYLDFLNEVAELNVVYSKKITLFIFKLLELRDLYDNLDTGEMNPINRVIKNLLCVCRKKISATLVYPTSMQMYRCIAKKITITYKKALNYYKIALTKQKLLRKAHQERKRNIALIKRLKQEASFEVKQEASF